MNAYSQWEQLGQYVNAASSSTGSFGWSIALSSDGLIVAGGAPQSDHVHVFSYNINMQTWEPIGQDVTSGSRGEFVGQWVPLSSNGCTRAVGAVRGFSNDLVTSQPAHCRAFRLNPARQIWEQMGQSVVLTAKGTLIMTANPLTCPRTGTWFPL